MVACRPPFPEKRGRDEEGGLYSPRRSSLRGPPWSGSMRGRSRGR